MKIGGGGGGRDKDSGRGSMYLGEEGYLKASFSLLRPRILSLGNTSFQQRTGMISHPGDQGLSQLAGLHMGFSSSRCSVGTHLLPPSTSCQCPAGSCFLGESPGMFPETGPVIDFSGTPRGGLAWGESNHQVPYPTTELVVGERRCTQAPLSPTTCSESNWASLTDSMS